MNISSLCHRDIVSISGSASVRQAAEAMRSHHMGVRSLCVSAIGGAQPAAAAKAQEQVRLAEGEHKIGSVKRGGRRPGRSSPRP